MAAARPRAAGLIGRARRIEGGAERYVEFAKATFPKGLSLDGCASWSTAPTAPPTGPRRRCSGSSAPMSCPLGVEPDGSTSTTAAARPPEACRRKVVETRADLGIALDGDADRVHI
jgi:phosphoglucosamine mutase